MTHVMAARLVPVPSRSCSWRHDHVNDYVHSEQATVSLATQRLIVPITAKDKARVEHKAAKAGKISTAEFVRRAALNYDPADEEAAVELRQLVDRFEEIHAATTAQLDRTDVALDAALAHFKAKPA